MLLIKNTKGFEIKKFFFLIQLKIRKIDVEINYAPITVNLVKIFSQRETSTLLFQTRKSIRVYACI